MVEASNPGAAGAPIFIDITIDDKRRCSNSFRAMRTAPTLFIYCLFVSIATSVSAVQRQISHEWTRSWNEALGKTVLNAQVLYVQDGQCFVQDRGHRLEEPDAWGPCTKGAGQMSHPVLQLIAQGLFHILLWKFACCLIAFGLHSM